MKLGSVFALFFFVTYVSDSLVSGADPAVTPGAKGVKVVDDVVKRIKDSGIFPNDHDFLRRIAQVESRCGDHPNTYRPGYHGGIWQVDKIGFLDTQDTASHPKLQAKLDQIKKKFGIDWKKVKWTDLRKPLYSALAARLLLSNKPGVIPPKLKDQADYWKKHYNSNAGAGTAQDFIDRVGEAKGDPHVCQKVKEVDDQLCYEVFGEESGDVYTFLDEPSLYKFNVKAELTGKGIARFIGKVTITSDIMNGPAIIDKGGIDVNNGVYPWGDPQQLTFGEVHVSINKHDIVVALDGLATVTLTRNGGSVNLNMDIQEVGDEPDSTSGIIGDVRKYVKIDESKNEAVIQREDGTDTLPFKLQHHGDKWHLPGKLPDDSSDRFKELLSKNKN